MNSLSIESIARFLSKLSGGGFAYVVVGIIALDLFPHAVTTGANSHDHAVIATVVTMIWREITGVEVTI